MVFQPWVKYVGGKKLIRRIDIGTLGGMVGGITDDVLAGMDASMVAAMVDEYNSDEDSDILAGDNDETESEKSDSSGYGSEASNKEFIEVMKNKKKGRESKKTKRRLVSMDAQNSEEGHVDQRRQKEDRCLWMHKIPKRIMLSKLRKDKRIRWTVTSDQQKGLDNAVRQLMPYVKYMNCARHIYANWKKDHNGYALNNVFWRAAKSNLEADFAVCMEEMKALSFAAYNAFKSIGVEKFCRSQINTINKCEAIDNNMSKCFDSYILSARSKPIMDMLESIQKFVMKRLSDKRAMIEKSTDILPFRDKTCECGERDLACIACPHAIACIYYNGNEA
ncbi:hypothetical protein CRG98_015570 [Punica granatum]|uniref:SWIM-type domain-containing protein n=1 Tax=Punica granatum TaxID=22663 RepID=A0A2I0K671_PUNGR|nr:hypothetical protein CRG98_015570 [Punica granatum]